ncbi:MAG: type IX secretion system membrane protein PorP/SprF [Bacteroidetes bacterium]|jgi:type IX secretion system PorP/SprF family membrane protein|nr:type IX secretion system membrane protein PorP/SprF [Bacteroidota bacterium]MBX7129606.1 type IX secretion system membrane protein PorP/SprF [Flavobacteriales bacterium]HMW96421.1 type IX secretion system membrane protein PorP/SprF [Flavobacteriales bacterium]HMZ47955.1 type IX secretion system membrane protein PorP/SprF [Flavobacteriales bacterium]HNA31515.1 type IX secretion system membrane protein PorP/SprF [Flavobacteriales bacterium]
MRGKLTAVVCAVVATVSYAQQDPQYTQFMFDRLSVNSGVAGTSGNLCATLLLRQQWSGFDGAPKTGLLNLQGAIPKINSGVGLSVYFDKLGQENSTIARLHYAYHVKLGGGSSVLGVGLYAGLSSRTLGSQWVAVDPVTEDDAIPDNGSSASGFDLGAGIYYMNKRLWAGLSSTQLPETELKNVSIKNKRHYYAQAGYRADLGKNFALLPSLLIKSDATSTQFDLNITAMYKDMVWLGATYRTEDAIAPMIGFQMPTGKEKKSMFKIGYSYDVTTSELRNYSSGSHEIMLNYCFMIKKKEVIEIYGHPRFL